MSSPEDLRGALAQLLAAVRDAYGEDDRAAWDALFEARMPLAKGDPAIVEPAIAALAGAPGWEARAAVADVLRWLPGPLGHRAARPIPRAQERACLLVSMMERETDARVRVAIVSAFIDLKNDIGHGLTASFVLRFATDEDAALRYAVVTALHGSRETAAIEALITLSADPDHTVRDWACFGLGHQLGSPGLPDGIVDTDAIREALAARIDDPDVETREEAITGLALRGDARGVEGMLGLLGRFDEEGVSERVLMTAEAAPDTRYVPLLSAIVEATDDLRTAKDALAACRAARPHPSCISPRHVGCACMRALPLRIGKR